MPEPIYTAGGTSISTELQMILRETGVGIWCYDGKRRKLTVDATCRQLFGLAADARVDAETLRRRVHPEDQSRYSHALHEALAGNGDFSVEYRVVRRDGSVRFISGRGRVRPHLPGQPMVVNGVCIDVTRLREVEERLQERTHELSRSNRELEQFAYIASHDLKAPLRAIEVLVEWLREDLAGFKRGDVQENLALLSQRTSRLHRLLDDLLAYSRAGRATKDAVTVNTRQMVIDIGVLLAPPPTMTIEADENLPVLTTWHAPLEQVLRNLINNAIKHHPTQKGLVRVYAETHEGQIIFAVEDDGAGIPLEYSEKVFQMFQTLKPRDEVEGSGMGLAIVKRIVEAQGGRVWFRPGRGGRGTVFKFTWPRPADAAGATGPHEARALQHSAR
jgi:PAS domain S-box-containing protein